MGSFKGHVIPGSLFILVGLWRLFNGILNYVSHPTTFRGRPWHPVRCAKGRFRFAELYVVAFGAFVDLCIEFLYSTHLKFLVDGELNPRHMNDFEHSAMLLMFFLFYLTCIINETTGLLSLPESALYLVASMAFTAEGLLFHFHSTSHAGLEGRYHQLLVLVVALCIIFAALGSAFPESFIVDFGGGFVLVLQGMWFYQTAFTLYGPLLPKGCHRDVHSEISCDAPEFEIRGQSIANSQLSAQVLGLFVVVLVFYAVAARVWGSPDLHEKFDRMRSAESIEI